MKRLFSILLLSVSLQSFGQGGRLQPGVVPTPVPVFDFTTISNLVSALAFSAGSNAGVVVATTTVNNYIQTNVTVVNNFNNLSNLVQTSADITSEYALSPTSQGTTNVYSLDFGKTNVIGSPIIYAHLLATNGCRINGLLNIKSNSLLSFNIVASGANRIIDLSSNIFHYPNFNTNGWTFSGTLYSLTLSNGNEMRITVKTNAIAFSSIWETFGQ